MAKYKYLLFDADNTLFDFTTAELLSFRDTCRSCDIEYSDEIYKRYSEINDSFWKLLEKGGITLDTLKIERFRKLLLSFGHADNDETFVKASKMRDTYMANLGNQSCLIDGAENICKKLSQDYALYIITNGVSKIQHSRFNKSALYSYFRDIFISEEIGFAKPAPEYFDYVIDLIGDSHKSAYLVIGDSLTSDCAGAITYGIDVCYFNPHDKPDGGLTLTYTIKKLSELEEIL